MGPKALLNTCPSIQDCLVDRMRANNIGQLWYLGSNNLVANFYWFLKENPYEVIKGVFKKVYVITLSPFKDTRPRLEDSNPIRYSNFPNKIIFNLSLIFLFINIFNKQRSFSTKKIDFYYLIILMTYFIPYIIGFVYPRHCTAMYTLAHLYVFLNMVQFNKFNINKLIKKDLKS